MTRRDAPRPGRALPVLVVGLLWAGLAGSAARPVATLACSGEGGESVRIVAVEAGDMLRLEDGRLVRLLGIDPADEDPAHPGLAAQVRTKLAGWLVGREARLVRASVEADRWNRWPALVFAETGPSSADQEGGRLSVAQALVDAGLARARPDRAIRACWPALVEAEAKARAASLGLWAERSYVVRRADASDFGGAMGRMAIVEGRITRIAHGRGATYVALGGPSGLTLRIVRHDRDVLADPALTDVTAVGTTVRARGFLDDRFGPTIDITSTDQVEVLRQSDAGAVKSPKP